MRRTRLSTEQVITDLVNAILDADVDGATDLPAVIADCYTKHYDHGKITYTRKFHSLALSIERNTEVLR